MYIKYYKVKRKGKVWEYARLVEAYKEGGKVRHRILKNLGPVKVGSRQETISGNSKEPETCETLGLV